jgi:hypothetical protein
LYNHVQNKKNDFILDQRIKLSFVPVQLGCAICSDFILPFNIGEVQWKPA